MMLIDELRGTLTPIDQLTQLLADEKLQHILVHGSPGMGKSSIVQRALKRTHADIIPLRLVCSLTQQRTRFGVLAPYLNAPNTELVSVREAVRDATAILASGPHPRWVVVEEGQYLDSGSAYVLSLLASMGKIRLLVVSSEPDGNSEINAILQGAARMAVLSVGPMGMAQLQSRLQELVGTQMTHGALCTLHRLTGGISDIVDAVVAQLLVVQPPPDRGPWALRHPVVLSGHGYRSRMQELVSRLDADTVAVHRELSHAEQLTMETIKSVTANGLGPLLGNGYLSMAMGQIRAKSSALTEHIAWAAGREGAADTLPLQDPETDTGAFHHSRTLMERGLFEQASELAPEVGEDWQWRCLHLAAAEWLDQPTVDGMPVMDPAASESDDPYQLALLSLDRLSCAFHDLDLEGCLQTLTALQRIQEQLRGQWLPRRRWLVEGTLSVLHLHGPGPAREFVKQMAAAAPSAWRERSHGLLALCLSVVHNTAGEFDRARGSAAEACAELLLDDPLGLLPAAQALADASAPGSGDPEDFAMILEELVVRLHPQQAPAWVRALWFQVAATLVANHLEAPDDRIQQLLGSPSLLGASPWAVLLPLTLRRVAGSDEPRTAILDELINKRLSHSAGSGVLTRLGSWAMPVLNEPARIECLDPVGRQAAAHPISREQETGVDAPNGPANGRPRTAVLERVGARLEQAGRETARVWSTVREPLTERECEIARLAKEGMSNRDIAGRLFLSRRTVEGHLYRAFQKLCISTREQLSRVQF